MNISEFLVLAKRCKCCGSLVTVEWWQANGTEMYQATCSNLCCTNAYSCRPAGTSLETVLGEWNKRNVDN